ncbi:MAG: hypothetical protein WC682_00020 [Parcubacteria group bacterium]|jgi:hypothetical protein
MSNQLKNWIIKKINFYFLFIALAFTAGVYLLLLDNSTQYLAKVNILISPKNQKTAIYLDKVRKNIAVIAQKNNIFGTKKVTLNVNQGDSLIEIQTSGEDRARLNDLLDISSREFLDSSSLYYDVKNDLGMEIVSREFQPVVASRFLIFVESILIGIGLSFLIQVILDLIEKIILFGINNKKRYNKNIQAKGDFSNFFKTNRERIQKLSSSPATFSSLENRMSHERSDEKNPVDKLIGNKLFKEEVFGSDSEQQPRFKKASSPFNLPVAEEDLSKIRPVEKEEIINDYSQNLVEAKNETEDFSDGLRDAFREPTEEDFKKRLNQLLGNK